MSNTRVEDLENELCLKEVPSGFNIYKWTKENPDTAIAHAIARTEKIFDNSDEIMVGLSGGKDSSLTAEISILELKRRWARVAAGIDREGNELVDVLDQKFVGKRIMFNSMDSEWIYSDTYNSVRDFAHLHGPGLYEVASKTGMQKFIGSSLHKLSDGQVLTMREIYSLASDGDQVEVVGHFESDSLYPFRTIKMRKSLPSIKINKNEIKELIKGDNTASLFYKNLRLGWQSGVSFGESRLTSWDLEKKDMWIRPMPTKEELCFEIVTDESIKVANPVLLESLPQSWQDIRLKNEDYTEIEGVKLVANFGLGSHDLVMKGYDVDFNVWTFEHADEDFEQESFAKWILESVPSATTISNLVALRAAESFDRYTILRQSDYSTGQYAQSKL